LSELNLSRQRFSKGFVHDSFTILEIPLLGCPETTLVSKGLVKVSFTMAESKSKGFVNDSPEVKVMTNHLYFKGFVNDSFTLTIPGTGKVNEQVFLYIDVL
jgi:hypothetical protein